MEIPDDQLLQVVEAFVLYPADKLLEPVFVDLRFQPQANPRRRFDPRAELRRAPGGLPLSAVNPFPGDQKIFLVGLNPTFLSPAANQPTNTVRDAVSPGG